MPPTDDGPVGIIYQFVEPKRKTGHKPIDIVVCLHCGSLLDPERILVHTPVCPGRLMATVGAVMQDAEASVARGFGEPWKPGSTFANLGEMEIGVSLVLGPGQTVEVRGPSHVDH